MDRAADRVRRARRGGEPQEHVGRSLHRRRAQEDVVARGAGHDHQLVADPRRLARSRPLRLFGAGVDSGTYDYFTQAIVGKEHSSRGDYAQSEDDNTLVQGVVVRRERHRVLRLRLLRREQGQAQAGPDRRRQGRQRRRPGRAVSPETVVNGTYQPLSRPIFIYVSVKSAGAEARASTSSSPTTSTRPPTLAAQASAMSACRPRSPTWPSTATRRRKTGSVFSRRLQGRRSPSKSLLSCGRAVRAPAPDGQGPAHDVVLPAVTVTSLRPARQRLSASAPSRPLLAAVQRRVDLRDDRHRAGAARLRGHRRSSPRSCRWPSSSATPSGRRCSRDNRHFGIWPLVDGHAGHLGDRHDGRPALRPARRDLSLSEYAPPRTRRALKPALELLAGVPTIVYGYFALTVVTPFAAGASCPAWPAATCCRRASSWAS